MGVVKRKTDEESSEDEGRSEETRYSHTVSSFAACIRSDCRHCITSIIKFHNCLS